MSCNFPMAINMPQNMPTNQDLLKELTSAQIIESVKNNVMIPQSAKEDDDIDANS